MKRAYEYSEKTKQPSQNGISRAEFASFTPPAPQKAKTSKIFIINLDRATTRWEKMRKQLEKLGLQYERFSAIDAEAASDAFLNQYYSAELNRIKYYVSLSKSEIACYISHLKVCEKILSDNLDYAIVLEDDIELNDSFKLVPYALESVQNWNYIKLIAPFKKKKIVSRSFCAEIPATCNIENRQFDKTSNTQQIAPTSKDITVPIPFEIVKWRKPPAGTQAYAITRGGAKEFLAKRSRFFRPIDVDLQFTWETNLNIQGLFPSFCKLTDAPSEISRKKHYHNPLARLIYKFQYALCRR